MRSDYRSLWCLPLAGVGYLTGFCVMGFHLYKIIASIYLEQNAIQEDDDGTIEFGDYLAMCVHLILAILALIGILCILARWNKGTRLLLGGYKLMLITTTLQLSSYWLAWLLSSVGMDDEVEITRFELFNIVITTVFGVTLLATAYWIFSAICSLVKVLEAGGSGWEYMNAIQVREKGFQDFLINTNQDQKSRILK
eukprot:Protomagalhaensia_sp_Gyna_25__4940@NODE_532_length_3194_cov_386_550238_g416_i0_p3_GENE_NODE_532_length_3194_cov_386_550238_g416_i0NODE_532_length_3194_cov_386_550238_g416_i0_p3_ORF_typecomplete_len196_score21_50DUF4134/PF13572_6/0_091DUF4134/PF13572_6/2_8e03Sensor/PF13796_6/43Sensor/PF13796_6/37Ion_trans_2/PF07885_16/63Ion_trans_2/PF07885_16/6_4Ion_trans_2/PF07885_16/9_4e02_NODE_532_length_3194_cov_386_550238_g416_i05171104